MKTREMEKIKEFFASYEIMAKLSSDSNVSSIIINSYENPKKEVLNIKVIERISSKIVRKLGRMSYSVNDHVLCEFSANYNVVKLVFKLEQIKAQQFKDEEKDKLCQKYSVSMLGNSVHFSFNYFKFNDLMNIFSSMEQYCRRDLRL